ncbi:MAG TPA: carbohydrate-binding domain-containing protein [Clostridiales bacterium]|nr:carbohydrate-binding domain-containing protein [Clostridiales bacterium]
MKRKIYIVLVVGLMLLQIVGCTANPGPTGTSTTTTPEIDGTQPVLDSTQLPSIQTAEPTPNLSIGELSHRVSLDLSNPQADGVVLDGADIRIEKGGVYTLSGTLSGGVIVDCPDPVHLVLSGVTIDNPNGSAIHFGSCTDAAIEVAGNTKNTLSDAKKQKKEDSKNKKSKGKKGSKGTIYTAMPLRISGGGTLSITGRSKHGITCEGALTIADCALTIQAESDGIHADGNIAIQGGSLTYTGGGNGVRSGADVSIDSGALLLSAQASGIKSKKDFTLKGGSVIITGECKEGIQSGTKIRILGGSLDITSRDDPMNAQTEIEIAGGRHFLKGGDDGLDSNGRLLITGGTTVVFGTAPNYGADCNDNPFVIEGGILIACGEYNTIPSNGTTQGALIIANVKQGLLAIEAEKKPVLLMMLPCEYASVLVSAPGLKLGRPYTITAGGQAQGEGLLDNATPYDVGESKQEFTLDTLVNSLTMP